MTFTEFAMAMHPFWIFGGLMFWAISKSSYKDILTFDWKAFGKWFCFICLLSTYRYFTLRYALSHGIGQETVSIAKTLPLGAVFFTPWEDLCHSVPLVILRRMLGTSKWLLPVHWLLTLAVMISFGMGHLYQGLLPAAFLSLYIPFSVRFIQKRGAGTLMAGHVLYDFSTLSVIKFLL